MEYLTWFVDVMLHLDVHLATLAQAHGPWVYGLLFVVVFCETGLVVTPFLPGDSLLFAVGALGAAGALDPALAGALLLVAAVAGDAVNYAIGQRFGARVFAHEGGRFIKREHLERTHSFYERHGGKTIILARFLPIIRTFAPFVAGVAGMGYVRFLAYNVVGAVVWVVGIIVAGYVFGAIPVVKDNFSLVVIAIVLISALPAAVEVLRAWAPRLGRAT